MELYKINEVEHIDSEVEAHPNFISSLKLASPKHGHDFYEFFLVTRGQCIHKVNNSEQLLNEGALVLIRPEDVHSYEHYGDNDCQFINIACTNRVMIEVFKYVGEEFTKFLLRGPMPPFTVLYPLEKDNFISRYEKLKMLSTIDKPQARIQLRSILVEILVQYFLSTRNIDKRKVPLWMEALLTQMQKKENFTLGLQRMYELSGRSVGHLNRAFRQFLNMTPTEYVNQLKLNCARNLLLTTDLSIVEVAMEAGFENLSHFYHLFKRIFNNTPSGMRARRVIKV